MLAVAPGSGPWAGPRATYVAIAGVSILGLALLTSIWHSDVSGTIALLGLLSVYLSSTELLLLFTVLAPVSIVVDIIRLSGPRVAYNGRGTLVFLSTAEILAKAAGAVFGWSLHRSISAGEGGGVYQPMNVGTAPQGVPPPSVGQDAGHGYQAQPGADPFSGYAPPRNDGANGASNSYQPFPASVQPHV